MEDESRFVKLLQRLENDCGFVVDETRTVLASLIVIVQEQEYRFQEQQKRIDNLGYQVSMVQANAKRIYL